MSSTLWVPPSFAYISLPVFSLPYISCLWLVNHFSAPSPLCTWNLWSSWSDTARSRYALSAAHSPTGHFSFLLRWWEEEICIPPPCVNPLEGRAFSWQCFKQTLQSTAVLYSQLTGATVAFTASVTCNHTHQSICLWQFSLFLLFFVALFSRKTCINTGHMTINTELVCEHVPGGVRNHRCSVTKPFCLVDENELV